MNFKFELKSDVIIKVSGECGTIVARAEYLNGCENGYNVHYKAADGRACTSWFDESHIELV